MVSITRLCHFRFEKAPPQQLKPTAHGPVHYPISDPDDHSAENPGVDSIARQNFLLEQFSQSMLLRHPELVVGLGRGRDLHLNAPEMRVNQPGVLVGDGGDEPLAVFFYHDI